MRRIRDFCLLSMFIYKFSKLLIHFYLFFIQVAVLQLMVLNSFLILCLNFFPIRRTCFCVLYSCSASTWRCNHRICQILRLFYCLNLSNLSNIILYLRNLYCNIIVCWRLLKGFVYWLFLILHRSITCSIRWLDNKRIVLRCRSHNQNTLLTRLTYRLI